MNDGRKESLVVNHGDDCEEHDEQRGKRQGLFEGVADAVLLGNAIEGCRQHDNQQAYDTGLGQVKAQRQDQDECNNTLHRNHHFLLARPLRAHVVIELLEHQAHFRRELRAIAEDFGHLEHGAGQQSDNQHRHRDMRHLHEEFGELPVHDLSDEQVLRFTNERGHATECRTHGTVHHQAAQERAEAFEILTMQLDHLVIGGWIVVMIELLAGCHLVVDAKETRRDRDDDSGNRQRIEKRGKKRGREREQHRQQHFGTHAQQDLRERKQQHLTQEVDAGDHEHEQHDDGEIDFRLMEHHFGCCQSEDDGLDGQQSTGLQGVALQRHRQRENELKNKDPASDERIVGRDNRINNQEAENRGLVPIGRVAKKILAKRFCKRVGHLVLILVFRGGLPTQNGRF